MESWCLWEQDPAYQLNQHKPANNRRFALVNWIMQVGMQMQTHSQTVQTAIFFMDRYLNHPSVPMKDADQDLAVCALSLAAKLNESKGYSRATFERNVNIPGEPPIVTDVIFDKVVHRLIHVSSLPASYYNIAL